MKRSISRKSSVGAPNTQVQPRLTLAKKSQMKSVEIGVADEFTNVSKTPVEKIKLN